MGRSVVGIIVGAWLGLTLVGSGAWGSLCVRPGEPAPDFTLGTLDGRSIQLEDYRGKVVLLVFWATWCPRCMEQLAFLQGLHTSLGERLAILAVNQETQLLSPTHVAKLRDDLAGLGVTFPVPLDVQLDVWKAYCVGALPTTLILDREGTVRFAEANFYWASKQKIEAVLSDLGVPVR